MDGDRRGTISREVRTLFEAGTLIGLSDGQLLERFLTGGGEAAERAFAGLVGRHGPMVLRVCRSVVCDPHEAQDAFQATFLVLVKKAGSIRKQASLASWLYGVAYRVASRSRVATARRRRHERRAAERTAGRVVAEAGGNDLAEVLHEEVRRLPERYRAPVVLCDLEGLTHEQAAGRLDWPVGSVKGRLARGRERLRARLVRRGLAPSAGRLGSILPAGLVSAPVPLPVVHSLSLAAVRFAAGRAETAGVVSASVVELTRGVLRVMRTSEIASLGSFLLAAGILAAGTGLLAQHQAGDTPKSPPARTPLPDATGARGADVVAKAQPKAGVARPPGADRKGPDAAAGVTLEDVPAVVVETIPRAGSDDVDPGLTEIKVIYSKDMQDGNWSWTTLDETSFPETTGKPRYLRDRRTCVLPVVLKPGKTYATWLNSQKFRNFQDTTGRPAVPYLLVFRTRAEGG